MKRLGNGVFFYAPFLVWFLFTAIFSSQLHGDTNSNDTINADQVYAGGSLGLNLAGRGVTVGIWDGGLVRSTHEMFAGGDDIPPQRIVLNGEEILSDGEEPFALESRVVGQQGGSTSQHATHVAGIIGGKAASRPGARGVADEVEILSWTASNHTSEMANNAHLLDLSNHSYGLPLDPDSASYGDYSGTSRTIDQIAYDNPHYLSVWSAGNDGNSFDTLTGFGKISKNTLTVGSVNDHTVDPHNGNTVSLSSFSSRGPTDDGRLAPHVVTNGAAVLSANNTGDAAYVTLSGTSMAAPAATGAGGAVD